MMDDVVSGPQSDSIGRPFQLLPKPVPTPSAPASSAPVSGDDLWRSGCYQQLSVLLEHDLAAAEALGDCHSLIDSANDLACARRAAGDHQSAAYFQLLAAASERRGSDGQTSWASATSLGNLACDALLAGRFALAEGLLWKSLLIELAQGNDSGAAADWANLGLLAGLMGDFETARERLWFALKLHRRLGDAFHVALDLWHLAQMAEIEGDWSQARRLFDRATRWFRQANHSEFHLSAQTQAKLNAAREAVVTFDVRLN